MLAYVLALAVGLGSLGIYLAAFFFPEIHRKNDFVWSGVGMFYALALWVCAGRITGGVLLGQVAGVALLGWSVTQTLSLRRQLTPRQQQTELPSAEEVKNTVQEQVSNLSLGEKLSQLRHRVTGSITGVKDRVQGISKTAQKNVPAKTTRPPTVSPTAATGEAVPAVPVTNVIAPDKDNIQIIDNRTPIPEQRSVDTATTQLTTEMPEVMQPNSPADELVQATRESAPEENSPLNLVAEADAVIEPALTEEEAIALAVETTLAKTAIAEASSENQEGSSEPVRPNPPDPELVEAAIRDAEEKAQEASPPDSEATKNP